jgi:hypothetical protein
MLHPASFRLSLIIFVMSSGHELRTVICLNHVSAGFSAKLMDSLATSVLSSLCDLLPLELLIKYIYFNVYIYIYIYIYREF